MLTAHLTTALRALVAGVPSLCAICRRWSGSRVCATCVARFAAPALRCQRCAIRVPSGVPVCLACLRSPPPFDSTIAAVDYAFPWSTLVAAFKFNEALDLSASLAHMLLTALRRSATHLPDILVPVPLSAERLRERGFNQAWELTRRLAMQLPCRADAGLLLRVRDTGHQLAVPAGRRRENVRGAFAIEPLREGELQGRNVAFVDDVMTTGATLSELTRVAKNAGATSVQCWVLARTHDAPGPAPASTSTSRSRSRSASACDQSGLFLP